ncbi:MAG: ATP-binding cassette domain-containing protein [Ignisphaera sp.]|uniref:ATP-binding cassette domain-containing protein n=1 Tax=Ignisphaera aggregans TaxID=334771 RepID=A0A7C4NND5_9CREN
MIIELNNVWHRYEGSKKWILREVSVIFREGEAVLITGHNGSGKTTLLKIASFILKPLRGKIYVDKQDFWRLSEEDKLRIRRNIVYVHEKPIMLKGSVVYNVAYPLLLRGCLDDEALEKAMYVLKKLGAEDLAEIDARKLSAGQMQLISIARALILGPKIVFLDEPFAHLDVEKQELIVKVIKEEVSNGNGIVITTHTNHIEYKDLDRIIVMKDGMIIEDRSL